MEVTTDTIMDSIFEMECKLATNKSVHDYKILKEQVVNKAKNNFFEIGYVFAIRVRLREVDSSFEEIKKDAIEIADMILKKRLYTKIQIDLKDFITDRSIFQKAISAA